MLNPLPMDARWGELRDRPGPRRWNRARVSGTSGELPAGDPVPGRSEPFPWDRPRQQVEQDRRGQEERQELVNPEPAPLRVVVPIDEHRVVDRDPARWRSSRTRGQGDRGGAPAARSPESGTSRRGWSSAGRAGAAFPPPPAREVCPFQTMAAQSGGLPTMNASVNPSRDLVLGLLRHDLEAGPAECERGVVALLRFLYLRILPGKREGRDVVHLL